MGWSLLLENSSQTFYGLNSSTNSSCSDGTVLSENSRLEIMFLCKEGWKNLHHLSIHS